MYKFEFIGRHKPCGFGVFITGEEEDDYFDDVVYFEEDYGDNLPKEVTYSKTCNLCGDITDDLEIDEECNFIQCKICYHYYFQWFAVDGRCPYCLGDGEKAEVIKHTYHGFKTNVVDSSKHMISIDLQKQLCQLREHLDWIRSKIVIRPKESIDLDDITEAYWIETYLENSKRRFSLIKWGKSSGYSNKWELYTSDYLFEDVIRYPTKEDALNDLRTMILERYHQTK